MTDLKNTYNQINDFINNPEEKVLLLTGIDDERKPELAFYCINKSSLRTGVIRISNSTSEIPGILKDLGEESPKSKYKYNDPIRLMNKIIVFDNYVHKRSMNYSTNKLDFAIIYPVQSICVRDKEKPAFIEMLNELKVKKVIMITTNESNYDYSWLDRVVSKKVSLNSENDNPEKYKMVSEYIKNHKEEQNFKDTYK